MQEDLEIQASPKTKQTNIQTGEESPGMKKPLALRLGRSLSKGPIRQGMRTQQLSGGWALGAAGCTPLPSLLVIGLARPLSEAALLV